MTTQPTQQQWPAQGQQQYPPQQAAQQPPGQYPVPQGQGDGSFSLGGNSGKSFSFGPQGAQPGASITGVVLDMKEVQQTNYDTKKLEFWDNGDPKMQYRVTLQTQLRDAADQYDDGKRDLYLDGRRKANDNGTKSRLFAVLDAVRQATGGQDLQRGATLTVTWVSGMGFSGDPRNYEAQYYPPQMSLGGQQGQPQPAQQAAPPVQQQYPPQQAQQGPPPGWAQQQPQQPAQQQLPIQQGQPQQQAAPPVQQPVQQPTHQGQLPPGVEMTPELQAAIAAANQPQPQQ